MIFCLDDEILSSLENGVVIPEVKELFVQLSAVISSNQNVLTVNSNLILKNGGKIIASPEIDSEVKRVVKYCLDTFTQVFYLTKRVEWKVIINLSRSEISNNIIYLSWDYLKQSRIVLSKEITFLAENISDCKFYENICKKYIDFQTMGVSIMFRRDSGGGITMAESLENAVTHCQEIVFALVDSDKHWVNDVIGNTAVYLQNKYNELIKEKYIHMHYHVLDVAEKENLIMPSEYECFLTPKSADLKEFLCLENDLKLYEFLKFLDFKAGVKKGVYLKNKEYFDQVFSRSPRFRLSKDINTIKDGETISRCLGSSCLKKIDYSKINTSIDTYVYEDRYNISKLVFSFGISMEKQIIN